MKLMSAKCPNCGAGIEVNQNLEKTICQYCGSTVLVNDAIEKYKIELSGKVEVDGIKSNTTRLEEAKTHAKVGEYVQAIRVINELLEKDHFNIEAHCEYLKNMLNLYKIKIGDGADRKDRLDNTEYWEAVSTINKAYERLKKIDDKKQAPQFLEGYLERLSYCDKIEKDLIKDEQRLNKLKRELYDIEKKYATGGYEKEVARLAEVTFYLGGGTYSTRYRARTAGGYDDYTFSYISKITRSGGVEISYSKVNSYVVGNPYIITVYHETEKKVNSIEEVERRIEQYKQTLQQNMKRRGKFLEAERRGKMTTFQKVKEDAGKVTTNVAGAVGLGLRIAWKALISCIPISIISYVCSSAWTEITANGITGGDIVISLIFIIPCAIWLFWIWKNWD